MKRGFIFSDRSPRLIYVAFEWQNPTACPNVRKERIHDIYTILGDYIGDIEKTQEGGPIEGDQNEIEKVEEGKRYARPGIKPGTSPGSYRAIYH